LRRTFRNALTAAAAGATPAATRASLSGVSDVAKWSKLIPMIGIIVSWTATKMPSRARRRARWKVPLPRRRYFAAV